MRSCLHLPSAMNSAQSCCDCHSHVCPIALSSCAMEELHSGAAPVNDCSHRPVCPCLVSLPFQLHAQRSVLSCNKFC